MNRFDPSARVLEAQFEIVKSALSWDVDSVSKRTIKIAAIDAKAPISGHNGEWLGVLCGAWGAFLRTGRMDLADEAERLIVAELEREAAAFRYLRDVRSTTLSDTALLKLAAILTHNVGDVDQGLSYWDWVEGDDMKKKEDLMLVSNEVKEKDNNNDKDSGTGRDSRGKVRSGQQGSTPAAGDGVTVAAGELLQSKSPWAEQRLRYSRLAHERGERFGGTVQ